MKVLIDIGTNSIRCLSEREGDLEERLFYTRIGEGVSDDGKIKKASYQRTLSAIEGYLSHFTDDITLFITATSAIREAKNKVEVLEWFFSDLGCKIRVLTKEEEAYYNYLGATLDDRRPVLVLDIGGGSTEVVTEKGTIVSTSLPIGALRLFENEVNYLPLLDYLAPFKSYAAFDYPLVGTGGTITSLAFLKKGLDVYDKESLDGTVLTFREIQSLLEKITKKELSLESLPKKRRDIFVSGIEILLATIKVLDKEAIRVKTSDGLYGLYYYLEEKREK